MLNRIQNCSVVVSFYYLFIISLCRAYQIVRVGTVGSHEGYINQRGRLFMVEESNLYLSSQRNRLPNRRATRGTVVVCSSSRVNQSTVS